MITYDTGALIAVERRDRRMLAFMTQVLARGRAPSATWHAWGALAIPLTQRARVEALRGH